jgi:hypothetical protein
VDRRLGRAPKLRLSFKSDRQRLVRASLPTLTCECSTKLARISERKYECHCKVPTYSHVPWVSSKRREPMHLPERQLMQSRCCNIKNPPLVFVQDWWCPV